MSQPARSPVPYVLFALILLLTTSSAAADLRAVRGETMGTTYEIKWVDQVENESMIQQRVDSRLMEINKLMSTYDRESEISRFNRYKETDWFPVSTETATVVDAALQVSQLSGGAFDPTVGRLVRLWSFGSDSRTYDPPDDAVIEEALKSVGHQLVEVRTNPPALRKINVDVELDLSAIAKGYGVDAIVELLQEQRITNCMAEIGGEVRVSGSKNGVAWTLGIERPEQLTRSLHAKVELRDEALATSGDYRNYFEKNGVRYSHTIDPFTGRPVTHQLASASVLAKECMLADAWSTTMMVLGPKKGIELADANNMVVYLLERRDNDFRELGSKAAVGQFVNLTQAEPNQDQAMSPLLSTFLLALAVFAIAIVGLAVGVIVSNRSLKGSCGGVAGTKDESGKSICEMCTTPPEECDEFKQKLRDQIANTEAPTPGSV